jgi:hypothetical protein
MAANPTGIRLSQGSELMAVATPGKKIDDRHIRLEYMGGRRTVCRRGIKAVEKRYLTSKGAFEFDHIDPAQKSSIYEKMIRRIVSDTSR